MQWINLRSYTCQTSALSPSPKIQFLKDHSTGSGKFTSLYISKKCLLKEAASWAGEVPKCLRELLFPEDLSLSPAPLSGDSNWEDMLLFSGLCGPPHTHTIEKGRDSLLQAVIIRVMFLSTKLPKWNKVWVSLKISLLKGKVLLLPNPVLEGLIFSLPCDKMGSVGRHFRLTLCFHVWGSLEVDTVWSFQSELLSSHGTTFLSENDWERNWLSKLCSLTFSLKVIRTLSH